ncbi:MAG: NYN domain-containing protein [Planctomycetota bacterium]
MPIVIDGYNLLRYVINSNEGYSGLSDIQICRIIRVYLRRIGDKAVIVFDGTGPRDKTPFENLDPLEVVFSGGNKEADEVIETKILVSTAPKRLIIVSNDRRIIAAARRRRSASAKCEIFWAQLTKVLESHASSAVPQEKYNGLSAAETEQWIKSFGLQEQ